MNWVDFLHARTWCQGTLKPALSQLKNKSMNWADFFHAEIDGIIFV